MEVLVARGIRSTPYGFVARTRDLVRALAKSARGCACWRATTPRPLDISVEYWRFLHRRAAKAFPAVYEWTMTTTILLTGFGPFPGAPHNPTEALVAELARRRHPAFANVRRVAHVFRVTYDTIDRELPELVRREKPDALLMFGLAARARTLRVETRARNAITRRVADAGGLLPATTMIVPDGPLERALRAPAPRLVMAARGTGVPVTLSRDAGGYLCNYLCWRAAEMPDGPRLATFVHVPLVRGPRGRTSPWTTLGFDDLVRAGETILRAVVTAVRVAR
jgi:pyroglutamyl-peptidase